MAKFNYVRVIQFVYNGQRSDENEYPTDSQFNFRTKEERKAFHADLDNYMIAHKNAGGHTHCVRRRIPISSH